MCFPFIMKLVAYSTSLLLACMAHCTSFGGGTHDAEVISTTVGLILSNSSSSSHVLSCSSSSHVLSCSSSSHVLSCSSSEDSTISFPLDFLGFLDFLCF